MFHLLAITMPVTAFNAADESARALADMVTSTATTTAVVPRMLQSTSSNFYEVVGRHGTQCKHKNDRFTWALCKKNGTFWLSGNWMGNPNVKHANVKHRASYYSKLLNLNLRYCTANELKKNAFLLIHSVAWTKTPCSGWSEWSKWSACSKYKCGPYELGMYGEAKTSTRTCLKPGQCVGKSKKTIEGGCGYTKCNLGCDDRFCHWKDEDGRGCEWYKENYCGNGRVNGFYDHQKKENKNWIKLQGKDGYNAMNVCKACGYGR